MANPWDDRPLSLRNIHLLQAGYITAKLFTGRPVLIIGWRMVIPPPRPPKPPKKNPDEFEKPPPWEGAALLLEFEDGSRHHGYDPATIEELGQAFHGLNQARAALRLQEKTP